MKQSKQLLINETYKAWNVIIQLHIDWKISADGLTSLSRMFENELDIIEKYTH